MASNRSTPRSVLHAPKPEIIVLHETKGPNRQERRHGGFRTLVDEGGAKRVGIAGAKGNGWFKRTPQFEPWKLGVRKVPHLAFREAFPTENEPYVKPVGTVESIVSKSKLRRVVRRLRRAA